MKEKVDVALIQFAPEWLMREKNARRMSALAEAEAIGGAELIVFPELANIGYIALEGSETPVENFAVEYLKAAEPLEGPTIESLGAVCEKHGVFVVVGIAELHPVIPHTLFNSAVLIGPDGIIGTHHKIHTVLNENSYFYPGDTCEVFATPLGNIGMTVCYDTRFPEVSRVQSLKGAEIICAPIAASMSMTDLMVGAELFKYRSSVRAHENCVYFLSASRSGQEGETYFLGHSAVAAPNGQIIAYSESEQEDVIRAQLSNTLLMQSRTKIAVFRDRRPELYTSLVEPVASSSVSANPDQGESPAT